ncbi:hypothetical protein CL614_05200 [archaeon]|nr:hypothetical protein [archaeon]|tara:strand:- start:1179 stop:1865 length:687 start_codon:yes stop_codon:yes gene_type:complete
MGYFYLLDQADVVVILDHVQFEKRSWQCRNRIKSADGELTLTVPTLRKNEQPINEVEINNDEDWKKRHLKAIESSYGKSEFFAKYKEFFQNLYQKDWKSLANLNIEIIKFIANELGIKAEFIKSSELGLKEKKTGLLVEICQKVKADKYLSTPGSRVYMINDENLFNENNIDLKYMEFNHPEYPQQYNDFIPYMSVIDALFNIGPEQTLKLIQENGKNVEPEEVKIND